MLTKKMETALNKQFNYELYASNLYLSMSAYFSSQNLNGFAHWMRIQSQEEMSHALKIFDHLIDRDGTVKLGSVPAPQTTWKTPLAAAQAGLKAEVDNTKQINEIVDAAVKEKDHATQVLLQWFVNEQVEEEASANDLVEQVKLAGNSAGAMFVLDRELGQRQPPAAQPA